MNRELFYKSEGVNDCVKWLTKEIKSAQEQQNNFYYSSIDYNERINTMIRIKISLEKYAKKLKHQANES